MKIDNSTSLAGSASTNETRKRDLGKVASNTQSAPDNSVRLSGLSAQLQSSGETAPTFDAARVSQIKQAIADGKFQINAGAIAERLISSARELVSAKRQG